MCSQQIERGRFIGADDQPAGRVIAQLGERVIEFQLQVLEAPSVFEHRAPGVGEEQVFAGAVDQLLAEFLFQPLQGQRDRGLRAEQFLGRARETAFSLATVRKT